MRNPRLKLLLLIAAAQMTACMGPKGPTGVIPALEYADRIRLEGAGGRNQAQPGLRSPGQSGPPAWQSSRAQLRLARDESSSVPLPADSLPLPTERAGEPRLDEFALAGDTVTNLNGEDPDVEIYRSRQPNVRDYSGPLALGDPGLSSSLWQESRRENSLYRDDRAWRPLDLITILVFENSEGSKEAETEIKGKSTILASIESWLGIDTSIADRNSQMQFPDLIKAKTTNDFKGEGETTRKGSLKGTISGMVVEVLPGEVLRVEGKKIIAVNQEEQVMVISGLVRPRDIDSNNQIDSAKIANMRIDYYGNGTVGEAQLGGWFARLIRVLWPF